MSLLYNPQNETLFNRAQLAHVPTPPAQGRFHRPLPFGEYAEFVADALDRNGLAIAEEEYAVSKDHNRFFGLLEVTNKPLEGELITAEEWRVQVGLRGSHDQRIPRGLTLGSRVLVCSNLCFHGNLGTFATKQTTNILARLPGLIRDAVSRIPQLAQEQEVIFDRYKNTELKPRWGDAALVEIHRRGGLTAPQLGRAIQEWDTPTYEEHAEGGHNVWRLFNAATEALKPTGNNVNHDTVRDRSQVVSGFLNHLVDIKQAA